MNSLTLRNASRDLSMHMHYNAAGLLTIKNESNHIKRTPANPTTPISRLKGSRPDSEATAIDTKPQQARS